MPGKLNFGSSTGKMVYQRRKAQAATRRGAFPPCFLAFVSQQQNSCSSMVVLGKRLYLRAAQWQQRNGANLLRLHGVQLRPIPLLFQQV